MGVHSEQYSIALRNVEPQNYLQLALRALAELADTDAQYLDNGQLLDAFCQAFAMDDSSHRDEMLAYLRRAGISDDDIIDKIIPTAARRVGEKWVRDELTFAQVTISASRMQELARFLSGSRERVPSTIPLGLNALLIIPYEEQHTMGTFIAADQLRRLGLWVHLAISQDAQELKKTVANNTFSMIGISAGTRRSVKFIKTIVEALKAEASCPPIILGGNIVNLVEDVQDQTGVDLASSNPREAVEFCGLPTNKLVVSDDSNIF